MAKRLRCLSKIRPTRNQIPSGNVGFNPDPIVAEQLRRLTKIGPCRNQIPSGSVGSNPTNYENFLILIHTVPNISVVDLYWFLIQKIFTLVTGSCGRAVKVSDKNNNC